MKYYLFLFILLFSSYSFAQTLWGSNTQSLFSNEAFDVEVDAAGNSYTTGHFSGQTSFTPSVSTPNSMGSSDVYIAKYNPQGNLIWKKEFGGNGSDRGYDLAIASNGDIYVTGQFFGQIDFDGTILQASGSAKEIFLLKMSSIGDVIWARKEGGSDVDNVYGVTTDSQNNVIITGQFYGNTIIGGQAYTSTIDPLTGQASGDMFIAKFDSNGNPLWSLAGYADFEDRILAVSTNSLNEIFVTGQFSDTLFIDGQQILNANHNVGFLAKINPTGQLQWLNTLKAGSVTPFDLEVNNGDEIIVVGDYVGTILYADAQTTTTISNPYSRKIFTLKTNNNGEHLWNESLGSENILSARSVSITPTNDVFITGYFSCELNEMQDETQESNFNSAGFRDAYLWKVNDSGNREYVRQFGGARDDIGYGVAIKQGTEALICGSYIENLYIPVSGSNSYSSSVNGYHLESGPTPVYQLVGDLSMNSFLTNAIDEETPYYNYFLPQGTDSLYGDIHNGIDTLHICNSTNINYNAHTSYFGPLYNYLWNTAETTNGITVSTDGTYSVEVTRIDGCSSGTDSIVVIDHSVELPLLSDSLGLAVNQTGSVFWQYQWCYPDSVSIWFSDLQEDASISIGMDSILYADTLPHFYGEAGTYYVTAYNEYCSTSGWFILSFDYPAQADSLALDMVLIDFEDGNDSISICEGDDVMIQIQDSITNPNGDYTILIEEPITEAHWGYPSSWTYAVPHNFTLSGQPDTTGWYTFTYTGAFGYDNLCGIDTVQLHVTDSFYIEVLPSPTIDFSIEGGTVVCPGDSTYLWVSTPISNFSWSGPNILWMSQDKDSIQVTAGSYSYWGTLMDSTSGCTKEINLSSYVAEAAILPIDVTPVDNVLCPGDSVVLSILDVYAEYNWTGPNEDSLSLDSDYAASEAGGYYVIVEDMNGCILASPPIEVYEYVTPSLLANPSAILCEGESTTLTVNTTGIAQSNWTTPVASPNVSITVNQGGWYYCEIQQCNTTIVDSIEIIDGTFSPSINISDSVLCFGQESTISTDAGYSLYNWSNGEEGIATIYVNQEGSYWFQGTNAYGCVENSDTVWIDFVEESTPPSVADVVLCEDVNLDLDNSTSGYSTEWYTEMEQIIGTGSSINISGVVSDTLFLVGHVSPVCPTIYDTIQVNVIDSLPEYLIVGAASLCTDSIGIYNISPQDTSAQWYLNNVLIGTGASVTVHTDSIGNSPLEVSISNVCFVEDAQLQLSVFPVENFTLPDTQLTLCVDEDLILSAGGSFTNVFWSGYFGESTGATLELSAEVQEGYITAYAEDLNGCTTDSDSTYIHISSEIYDIVDNSGIHCEGDDVDFEVLTIMDSISWTGPSGTYHTNSFSVVSSLASEGNYFLSLWDEHGCEYTDTVELIVNLNPHSSLPNDTLVCIGEFIGDDYVNDQISYTWEGSNVDDSILILSSGWNYVTLTDDFGCISNDSLYVNTVLCGGELPNVFTPNGDGVNDYFIIEEAPLYPDSRLEIINRWGNVMYESDGYANDFNGYRNPITGEEIHDGTYFYIFYKYGKSNPERIMGYLTIIR